MERGVPIRSVSRGIAVLQCVNRKGSPSLIEIARDVGRDGVVVMNLCGRGDKDIFAVADHLAGGVENAA